MTVSREAPFSASEAITFGFRAMRSSFTSIFLALGTLNVMLTVLEGGAQRGGQSLLHLILQVATAFVTIGWWRAALRIHDGQPVSLAVLRESTVVLFLQYVVTIALFWAAVTVGLVLLVVPGLVIGARLCLAPAIVVDEGLDPFAALRRSYELTEGRLADLWVFGLLLFAMNLLGALALGLGLFATIPTTYLAVCFVYRRLAAARPPATALSVEATRSV